MADKDFDKLVEAVTRRVPNATEVAVANFHQGSHPQRPIPPDLTEEERVALDRERSRIHSTNRVPMEEAGEPVANVGAASLPLIPGFRPEAGRLFVGATEDEEMMLRGVPHDTIARVRKAQAERRDPKQMAEAEEQAAAARNERRSAPEHGPEPDAPFATEATIAAVAASEGKAPPKK